MSRKPKFKPEITRVKLNPEQAVLSCGCYNNGRTSGGTGGAHGQAYASTLYCVSGRVVRYVYRAVGVHIASAWATCPSGISNVSGSST